MRCGSIVSNPLSRKPYPIALFIFWALLIYFGLAEVGPRSSAHGQTTSKTQKHDIELAQLQWNSKPVIRKNSLQSLISATIKQTSIDISPAPKIIRIEDKDLYKYPFLYLTGSTQLDISNPIKIQRLRRYLQHGGFLLVDSSEGISNGPFDKSIRELMKKVFPKQPLAPLKKEHVLFKTFFLATSVFGRLNISPNIEAIERDKRLVVVYLKNDLGGAWETNDLGEWSFECTPGGERQRINAFRMGVNIIMYSLCLDYKEDQTHVDYILKKRKWRPKDGAQTK